MANSSFRLELEYDVVFCRRSRCCTSVYDVNIPRVDTAVGEDLEHLQACLLSWLVEIQFLRKLVRKNSHEEFIYLVEQAY